MPKLHARIAMTNFLKTLADDWLIPFEMPTYTGPRTELGKVLAIEKEDTRRRREKYQQIQYLKRKKWVQVKKTERGLFVALSDQGRMELLARTTASKSKFPSGTVCLLMFDFPQSARKGRDAFRYFIKSLGFTQVQMSVWQSNRDCLKEVKRFIDEAKMSRWVKLFVAKEK